MDRLRRNDLRKEDTPFPPPCADPYRREEAALRDAASRPVPVVHHPRDARFHLWKGKTETSRAIHTPEPHAGAPSHRAKKACPGHVPAGGTFSAPRQRNAQVRDARASVAASGPAFIKASASQPPFSNELRYKGKRTARRSEGFAVLFPLPFGKNRLSRTTQAYGD